MPCVFSGNPRQAPAIVRPTAAFPTQAPPNDSPGAARNRESRDAARTGAILLVARYRLFRAGLRLAIERHTGAPVLECDGLDALPRQTTETPPGIVLVYLRRPAASDTANIAGLRRRWPQSRIMIISETVHPSVAHSLIKEGVRGYLLDQNGVDELRQAIETVRQDYVYLSPEITTSLLEDKRAHEEQDIIQTTQPINSRERDILIHIAEGLRNKEIAARLHLSLKSVETYRYRLMKRLGCDHAAGLVRYAIRAGLIGP